jgi:hypothetical protein
MQSNNKGFLMEINAAVHNISKLKDYFFLLPDYRHEYMWKVDDQVEQFLGQTPKDGLFTNEFVDNNSVSVSGNVTLLESNINQAVNKCNDLTGSWFDAKQKNYAKSDVISANLLNHDY